jgi:capsular exopolysaccharide synthesis family protein
MSGKLSQIPTQEQEYRVIERQQKIKEGIYLYLIQKREETAIALYVTEPNAKIVDSGRANSNPISPNKFFYYFISLLVGFGLPLGVLYLIFLLDDKIYTGSDVEDKSKGIPVLAEIPKVLEGKNGDVQKLEAFRTLLNNTNFITPDDKKQEGKVIYVTSAKKGEGKTFVAYNLATSYSNLDKKTILIGTDFRNPQLHKYLNVDKSANKGLSNYLHSDSYNWKNLVLSTTENDVKYDMLLAGDIPPNPTLLLSSERLAVFMSELRKEYEIIIVDTAPTLLVSDTLMISKYADTTLFVARSGITEKKLIQYAVKLKEEDKIKNVGYVVNSIDHSNTYGYGYGYGYGYAYGYNYGYGYGYGGDEEVVKPWYRRGKIRKLIYKFFKK